VYTRGHVKRESTSVLVKSRSDARDFSENVEGRIGVTVPLIKLGYRLVDEEVR
jgi:hypothetical protein